MLHDRYLGGFIETLNISSLTQKLYHGGKFECSLNGIPCNAQPRGSFSDFLSSSWYKQIEIAMKNASNILEREI